MEPVKSSWQRALHENSSRRDKPFIKVNCAAIPKDLMESELFGYERGAFTGAVTSKPGRFELASGGTSFFYEIAEIPVEMQVKLRVFSKRASSNASAASRRFMSMCDSSPQPIAT